MLKFHEWSDSKAVLVVCLTHRNKFIKDQIQVFNELEYLKSEFWF